MSNHSQRIEGLSPEKQALLALRLKQKRQAEQPRRTIPRGTDASAHPLSYAQQRLWFLEQLEPDSPLYNIPAVLRLKGRLDVRALEASLNEVLRRHAALRARFETEDGYPVQVIAPEIKLALPLVDLGSTPEAERERAVMRMAAEAARQPFDLARGPLVRANLYGLSQEEHILSFSMHHIISDGWSTGVLVREFAALYAAFTRDLPSPLPELPIQYADYAAWQREWLQGEVREKQLAYWKERLGDLPPALELPFDRPRPPVQTFRGASRSFDLPADLAQSVKSFSQREGVTPFITLLAAFQALLYRHTGQEDICVGTPVANRSEVELEALIGLFVNTLVLRSDLSGEPSFRELLGRVRNTATEAYDHQDLPFEMIVDALKPERSLSHSPLFQVMFASQEAHLERVALPGLELSEVEIDPGAAKFDLTLFMETRAEGMHGRIEFNCDLFDAATIERMGERFINLLDGALHDPDQSISKIPLLSAAERRLVLLDWNSTGTADPIDFCIHHLFEAQVARTPQATALVAAGQRLSYRELNARANRLAHRLIALGIGPESLVGVCMQRSVEMVVGLLGILKAGGAYVPLDPRYPKDRLGFMLEDAQIPVLLTQSALLEGLPEHSARVIRLDPDGQEFVEYSPDSPASTASPDNLAYVLFTSGSTGRPKGVAIEHRSAAALIQWARRVYSPEDLAGVLFSTSISFDLSVFELFVTLSMGGKVLLAENALQLPELAAANEVTLVNTVPSAMVELLRMGGLPASVRAVNLAGEPLPTPLVDQIYQATQVERVYDLYGPTEDTTYSTYTLRQPGQRATIGRPIDHTQVYLLDAHLEPVPVGVPGEVYIGGAGLARGYLNRPELTEERFIPCPVTLRQAGCPSPRLYKTGDLARYRADGNLEYLGRLDFQVKVRGFRIELGEIETVLRQIAWVKEAAVVAHADGPGQKRLVAYVAADSRAAPDSQAAALRSALKEKLPEYMLPAAFVFLESLPHTPNGKVDRKALPAPDSSRPDLEKPYVAPRDALERRLAEVWQQVLGLDRVGVHDNFFEIGGDSLRVAVLMNRLQGEVKEAGRIRAVFQAPTVAELAEHLRVHFPESAARLVDGAAGPESAQVQEAIPVIPRDGELPLSFAQQRLWFLDQLEPGSAFYNLPAAIRLTGRLDPGALRSSLNEIVRRHEILRTTFTTEEGKAAAFIAREARLACPLIDLSGLPAEERLRSAQEMAQAEARRPFDLVYGPLLRATLLRLDEQDHIVVLVFHHIVADGWSVNVLVSEAAALYRFFTQGLPSPLAELPVQYVDYAAWQRGWLQGEVLERQLEYWKTRLDGLPPLIALPTDRPRPAVHSGRGARYVFSLPAELSEDLRALSRRESKTLFMTLLAGFQALLQRYTGQTDIFLGTPVANRSRAEVEGLIGFFANTLVLRTDLAGEPSFRELLNRVHAVATEAYAHQDVPFEMIVDAVQPERNLSHSPLFQVLFAMQDASGAALSFPGLEISTFELDSGTAKFDLALSAADTPQGLRLGLEYSTDLFDAASIEQLAGHFRMLLEGAASNPEQPVINLPLLSEAERQQVLEEWSAGREAAWEGSAPQLFESQAARTPEAIALEVAGQTVTYAELNERANRLAHYLLKRGVGREVLVGVCAERSVELVVAILGVLKAGGAYLPLDPGLPASRLAFMQADSQVGVVLTQAHLAENFAAAGAALPQVTCLDRDWEQIAMERGENPGILVQPEDLAYVIYTSGSTGQPKGVLLEHRGLANMAQAYIRELELGMGSRVLLFFSISFDGSVADLFMSLLSGATLCIPPAEAALPGPDLLRYLQERRVTSAVLVPSALAALPEADLPRLRTLLSAGESCPPEVARRWAPGRRFYNAYGPTEATVAAAWHRVEDPERAGPNIPIGRPLPKCRIFILDSQLQPAPVGVPGEIYIGGAGVARGYLNRPELSEEKFIPYPGYLTPPAETAGAGRLYRTGDLGRWRADGQIEFLGRVDQQVKVRGFRIEPGEIEAALMQHPRVIEAVVVVRADPPADKRLVAYVAGTPTHPAEPSLAAELRSFLQDRLPYYMVPAAIVVLDALPLTPTGKVDRRALPAPEMRREDLSDGYIPPQTEDEAILASIWNQVLGVDPVGVKDNFFELGGDSILSIQVVAKAAQAGLRLTPRQFFQHPTIAELARVAARGQEAAAEQGPVTGPVALTPIQHWFFAQELPEPRHWNQAVLLAIRRGLVKPALRGAVEAVLSHHDALRLRFRRTESGWEAENTGVSDDGGVPENAGVPLEWVDLKGIEPVEQSEQVERRAEVLQRSLDLERGPLVRVAYFDLGPERGGRLLVVAHHLVVDGVSWRVLLEDLEAAYGQIARGQAVALPPKTASFQSWAQRLADYARSDEIMAQAAYWAAAGAGDEDLPVDFPGGENREAQAGQVVVSLSPEETEALLTDVPGAYGTEINDALLAALVEAVGEWRGRRSLRVALEGHGREELFDRVDLSRTVGWFTALYPVRLDLRGVNGAGASLKAVKEQLRRLPGRGIGYGLLRYVAGVPELQSQAEPRVSFNYLGQVDQALGASGLFAIAAESAGTARSPAGERSHWISLNGGVVGGRLQMEWSYSRTMYRPETIERVAQRYIEVLRELIAHCQEPEAVGYTPSDFPEADLSQAEIEALMAEISGD